MKKPMVKLNDGTSVPLEVFVTWHFNKQHAKTRPIEEVKKIVARVSEKNQRAIKTPYGIFSSVKDASEKTKIPFMRLRSLLLNTAYPEYCYLNSKPSDAQKQFHKEYNIKRKVTITPLGIFPSKSQAALAHRMPIGQFGRLMNSNPKEYYYETDGPKEKVVVVKSKKVKLPKEPKAKLTREERRVIALKIGETKRKIVVTPKGQFNSVNDAVKALGMTKDGLRNLLLNTAYPDYYYLNPTPDDIAKQFHKVYKGGPKKTVTPIGTFATKGLAAKALGITYDAMNLLIKNQPQKYYYSEDTLNVGIRKTNDPALYHSTKGYRLPKIFMTPTGPYPSKLQACLAYGLTNIEMDVLMKDHPNDFFKIR